MPTLRSTTSWRKFPRRTPLVLSVVRSLSLIFFTEPWFPLLNLSSASQSYPFFFVQTCRQSRRNKISLQLPRRLRRWRAWRMLPTRVSRRISRPPPPTAAPEATNAFPRTTNPSLRNPKNNSSEGTSPSIQLLERMTLDMNVIELNAFLPPTG